MTFKWTLKYSTNVMLNVENIRRSLNSEAVVSCRDAR
jgi:hypothetical protein